MAYDIGERVVVNDREAIITDALYSIKTNTTRYYIRYCGHAEDQDDLYEEDDIEPYEKDIVEYIPNIVLKDGVVIFSLVEVRNGIRNTVEVTHGHLINNDMVGVLQACSYAAKKAFINRNGGDVYYKKEN